MRIYKLDTNDGTFFVQREPTWKDMFAYIGKKRRQGYKLSEVVFVWGPIDVQQSTRTALTQMRSGMFGYMSFPNSYPP